MEWLTRMKLGNALEAAINLGLLYILFLCGPRLDPQKVLEMG